MKEESRRPRSRPATIAPSSRPRGSSVTALPNGPPCSAPPGTSCAGVAAPEGRSALRRRDPPGISGFPTATGLGLTAREGRAAPSWGRVGALGTGNKLSLGFGALLLILVVTALVVMGRLDQLEKRLQEITVFAEPAQRRRLRDGDRRGRDWASPCCATWRLPTPALREKVLGQARDFGRSRAQFGQLAKTPQRQETGERVSRLFLEYETAGLALMAGADRRRRLSVELGEGFEHADQACVRQPAQRSSTGPAVAARRRSRWPPTCRRDVADVGNWLGHYTRTLNPAYRTRLVDGAEQLEHRAGALREAGPDARGATPGGARARALARAHDARARGGRPGEDERERLSRFLDLRAELDAALRGETQVLAERDLWPRRTRPTAHCGSSAHRVPAPWRAA